MPVFANDLEIIARSAVIRKVVDIIWRRTPFLETVLARADVEKNTGPDIQVPVIVTSPDGGRWVQRGEAIPIEYGEFLKQMAFGYSMLRKNIGFHWEDLAKASSDEWQLMRFEDFTAEVHLRAMRDSFAQVLFVGDPTLNQPTGLNIQVDNTGTHGGLSRVTYPGLQSYVDNTTNTVTATWIQQMWMRIASQGVAPDAILTTPDVWNNFWQILYDKKSLAIDAAVDNLGVPRVFFNAYTRITADSKVPTETVGGNTYHYVYFLTLNTWHMWFRRGAYFSVGNMLEAMEQDVWAAKIRTDVAFWTDQPRLQAKATRIVP